MKGFGIFVKNELLDPKHIEMMGPAIWLYLWLIDKMTSIDEKGVGKVLGGKPVRYEDDIKPELGISADTYSRWIDKLLERPYIVVIRTPHGISFRVLKATKRFKGDSAKSRSDSAQVRNVRDSAEPRNVIKTDQLRQDKDPSAQTRSPHSLFVQFFFETCQTARGMKPVITGRDAGHLKRILDAGFPIDFLEQLAVFFLFDPSFKKLSPDISTMLSAGILNGISNRMKNQPGFWMQLDNYATRANRTPAKVKDVPRIVDDLERLKAQLVASTRAPAALSPAEG